MATRISYKGIVELADEINRLRGLKGNCECTDIEKERVPGLVRVKKRKDTKDYEITMIATDGDCTRTLYLTYMSFGTSCWDKCDSKVATKDATFFMRGLLEGFKASRTKKYVGVLRKAHRELVIRNGKEVTEIYNGKG